MGVRNQNSTAYEHPDEPNLLNLHKAMDYNDAGEPVLRVLTYSSGGTMDLTALSVTTITASNGGSLSYDNTTGVFTFAPANELGNLIVNGPDLQTISGTVNGADIVLEPLNGSVRVPALKIGNLGSVVNTTLNIEAYITTYELVSIVDSSTGPSDALASGVYGNINGVPAPWTVFELAPGTSGTPISAIEIDDKLTGAGIVPSTVKDRGLAGVGDPAEWNNYVIVNLDLAGLGQVLPIAGAVFNLTRPLDKANLNIQSATGTDIFLDSQGLGDVIVNTNILPVTTNISNLGSPTKRWKSVYIGPGTIYVLDETLGKDIAIGARDGLLYVQNGAGLTVGEFTLIDNQIRIANPARDMIIGTTGATADVVFNRSIRVKDNTNRTALYTDRTGRTQFYVPTIPASTNLVPEIGGVSIIGTPDGHYHGVTSTGGMLHITGNNGASNRFSMDAFGAGGNQSFNGLIARAGRGTSSSPTQLLAGDIIFRLAASGWRSDTGFSGVAAGGASTSLDFVSLEATADATRGSAQAFYNAPLGGNTRTFSGLFNATGLSFVKQSGDTDSASIGITFSNNDRLTYFPTPVGQTNLWLKSNGTRMSWQALPIAENPLVYKGAWNASGNSPALSTTTPVGLMSGWEYSISTGGTQNINGTGNVTYAAGGFVIFNGATWDYIPPVTGVASIQFDGGAVQSGAVQVQSSDITSTLNTGSIVNAKLANSSVSVTAGTGLSGGGTVALGGSITLTNAGVVGVSAGTGIGVSGTGTVTISNTGVLTVTGTNHISASVVSGAVTVTSDATTNATANTIALRDGAGGLEAKDYTATQDAGISSDHGPFNYGVLSYSDTGIMADFSYNANSYNQVILQNRSAGAAASTNYIVSNNQGTASTFYGEFGMNSSGFSGSGSFALPNAVYLASVSSDLVIGTLGNNTLRIVTNNSGTDAVTVNASGVATFANQIVGSISGSANNVRQNLTAGTGISFSTGTTYNGSTAITINATNTNTGTVTSVGGTGTVSGLTLTGTVTSTGNLTLGGTIDKASASTFGIAKVDGTTITATAGVISAVPTGVDSFTSLVTTQITTLAVDMTTGPSMIFWQPSANGNRAITLSNFTAGRRVKIFITPHAANNVFTFTGVTASQCSNGSITYVLGGGGVAQSSMMIEVFSTTTAIGGVWIFGFGSQ
jgi:hypothetical protein